MNTVLRVDYAEYAGLTDHFRTHAEQIAGMHSALQAAFEPLRTDWSGVGAAAFMAEMETSIFPAVQRLTAALHTAHTVALDVGDLISAAEDAAAALFHGDWASPPVGSEELIEPPVAGGPAWATTVLPGGPVFGPKGELLRLDLTIDEFEMLTAAERIQWVEALERRMDPTTDLDWFHNIQDIIAFFDESPDMDNMRRGSWASWADAGVLEAMQNGRMLHETHGKVPPGFNFADGAAQQWADFFDQQSKTPLNSNLLIPLWSLAEQSGVNYGSKQADTRIPAPALAPLFVGYGNLYRYVARLEDGGNNFVNDYAAKNGAAVGAVVGKMASIVALGPLSLLPFVDDLSGKAGGWAGSGAADLLIDDDTGSKIFDPRTIIFDDTYDNPASPPLSDLDAGPTIGIMPANIHMGHGPTYYLAKAVEKGFIGPSTLPDISVDAAGNLTFYNGTVITPDGVGHLMDRTLIETDGSITIFGKIPLRPVSIVLKGTRLNEDGTYTLSNGTIAQ